MSRKLRGKTVETEEIEETKRKEKERAIFAGTGKQTSNPKTDLFSEGDFSENLE